MIDGLAIILEDVNEGMAILKKNCPTEVDNLIDYFDCGYVSDTFKGIKVPGHKRPREKTQAI